MATTKKFDIKNPTDEMIENLETSAPGENGFHITKLSERDSRTLLDLLRNPPEPGEQLKKRAKHRNECWSFARERRDLLW